MLFSWENMKDIEKYINKLIAKDELWRFYKTREWITLRDQILAENHNECAVCKQKGIIKRYDTDEKGNKHLIKTVHHVQFVRNHPELALSRYYYYKGEKKENLIVVCKSCHNQLHPEKRKNFRKNDDNFMNEERW